jgi:hypothetical protein
MNAEFIHMDLPQGERDVGKAAIGYGFAPGNHSVCSSPWRPK